MRKSAQIPSGFTLLELLLVVGIVIVLTGTLLPSFNAYLNNQNVRQAQEQIKNDLRNAQNKALTGSLSHEPNVDYWGIVFTANSPRYEFFTTDSVDTTCPVVSRGNRQNSEMFPGGLVSRNTVCVLFSLENGDALFSASGNIIVGPVTGGAGCRRGQVNSAGAIWLNTTNFSCT